MMTAYTQTDLAVGLEAAVRGGEAEVGRRERVVGREDDAAVVETVSVGRVGGSAEGEVPFEEVGFERPGGVVCGRGVAKLGGFFH